MHVKKEHYILAIIFFLTLATRLYFAFQTNYFSLDAYFNLRQIEHIKENGMPLFNDPLSYAGRTNIFPPLFHYIMAGFSFIMPLDIAAKIIPNIFASMLVIVCYLISYDITKNRNAALFSAFISGWIPVFFSKTLNNVSVYSLIVPMMFFVLYYLMKIEENKNYIVHFIVVLVISRLTHQSIILLVFVFIVYMVILKVENIKQSRAELEVMLFSVFVILWTILMIYKKPFLVHGINVVWQNIPQKILENYFSAFNVWQAILMIGVIPFIFGAYIIYKYMFKEKNKKLYLLISFALTISILLWLRLIQLVNGLLFLSVILVLLFSQYYRIFFEYVEKTNLKKGIFLIAFSILFIVSSVYLSFVYADNEVKNSIGYEDIKAINWIKENTEKNSTILATVEEGQLIAYAGRKNVADSNFLLIESAEQRVNDISTMYSTILETEGLRLVDKYSISYIYFSDNAKKEFNIARISYTTDSKCFELAYNEKIKIYKPVCILEER